MSSSADIESEKSLVAEFRALAHCLKDAVVKTGQIYRFHAEARKLGIENHIQGPPRSLTASLGRDVEKYDQICDSIEAHLLRAISVLKRDLRREEKRIESEERRKQAETLMLPPPVPLATSEMSGEAFIPPASDESKMNSRNSPVITSFPGRRPSAISISSLHRPQFPLKLDLSSTSLRITEEEAAVFAKGLASPVTLAPKSARALGPSESFPELLSTFGGSLAPLDVGNGAASIELPHPDSMHISEKSTGLSSLAAGLGDSLDKPIELDLDAMDIEIAGMNDHFRNSDLTSDTDNAGDGLFSPALEGGRVDQPLQSMDEQSLKEENDLDNLEMDANVHDDLFGDFTSGGQTELSRDASIPHPPSMSIPSPNSLLAQFSSASDPVEGKSSSIGDNVIPDSGETFDLNSIDLVNLAPGFFSDEQGPDMNFSLDMESFLVMNSDVDPQGANNANRLEDLANS